MKLNGSEIIAECLLEQGVDTVFGYPGGAVLNIYDALYKYSDRITHILSAHEQGAAHAADGYARTTGKCGVVIATSGPGATNLVTGIATAYMDSVPMVAITGNVTNDLLARDSFQEVDICGISLPITKHNFIVKDVKDLANVIRKAFRIAMSGRKGPVLIDIPKDVTGAVYDYEPAKPEPVSNPVLSEKADFEDAARLNAACAQALEWEEMPSGWREQRELGAYLSGVVRMCEMNISAAGRRMSLLQSFSEGFLGLDGAQLLRELREANGKMFLMKGAAVNNVIKKIAPYCRGEVNRNDIEQQLTALCAYQDEMRQCAELDSAYAAGLGAYYSGQGTDWAAVRALADKAVRLDEDLKDISGIEGFRFAFCSSGSNFGLAKQLAPLWTSFVRARLAVYSSLEPVPSQGREFFADELELCRNVKDEMTPPTLSTALQAHRLKRKRNGSEVSIPS